MRTVEIITPRGVLKVRKDRAWIVLLVAPISLILGCLIMGGLTKLMGVW